MPKGVLLFLGRVLPAADAEVDLYKLHANDFKPAHTAQIRLRGMPLYREHKQHRTWGKILGNFQHDDGSQFIFARVDDPGLAEEIRSGKKRELSMSHYFQMHFNPDGTEVQTKIPYEVSVVKKGNRPGCFIYHFWETTSNPNLTHIFQNSQKMSTPASADSSAGAAAPAPAAAAAAAPAVQPAAETTATDASASASASAQAEAPAFDPSNPDIEKLAAALKAEGMSTEELFREVARLTIEAKSGETDQQRVQELESKLKETQGINEERFVKTYRQHHEGQGLKWDDKLEQALRHMTHEMPLVHQETLVNSAAEGAKRHAQIQAEMEALRRVNQMRQKDPSPSSFSAREYVASAGKHQNATHRVGGILSNSFVREEGEKIRIPLHRADGGDAAQRSRLRSPEEIMAALGL